MEWNRHRQDVQVIFLYLNTKPLKNTNTNIMPKLWRTTFASAAGSSRHWGHMACPHGEMVGLKRVNKTRWDEGNAGNFGFTGCICLRHLHYNIHRE